MARNTVHRVNSTRPRVRLAEGKDPSGPLRRLYDNGEGNVKLTRDGELVGRPTASRASQSHSKQTNFPKIVMPPDTRMMFAAGSTMAAIPAPASITTIISR